MSKLMKNKEAVVIGCDVGTGSVRAGVFDREGSMKSMATKDIQMWRPRPDFVEQSSADIWQACCTSITAAIKKAGAQPSQVRGIGFDATCSLVVLQEDDQPLSVSPTAEDKQNIIVWMDHRAEQEAEEINQTGHEVLQYVGGRISPEMETPKLLWLKTHHPDRWSQATKFFDLADFLVYKATGVDIRSVCTTTCKWNYLAHEERWDDSFFKSIGLDDLVDEQYARIGKRVAPVGEPVGGGLTEQAAGELKLDAATPVSVGVIDAHAGGLGLLDMKEDGPTAPNDLHDRFALIGGTSSCHMAVSPKPQFIDGVWGPYYSAMIPDMWLTEGGQSATGSLIDHIIFSSYQSEALKQKAVEKETTVYQLLNNRLHSLSNAQGTADVGMLTKDLHLLPYFHGNRSPRADASLLGGISGLQLSSTLDDLALLYLAAIQGIAYGTRHIIEALNEKDYAIKKIMAAGGGTKNKLFLKMHADICGCPIILPRETEAVLLGSAVLGATAGGLHASVRDAMKAMNRTGRVIRPTAGDVNEYHNAKYRVFHQMYDDQQSYRQIMQY